MKTEKKINFFEIVSSKANVEIAQKIFNSKNPVQFKDFKLMTNPLTMKKYSTRTIAAKLKELETGGLIESQAIKNPKRKAFGYAMTKKGSEIIGIIKEAEEKFEKIK